MSTSIRIDATRSPPPTEVVVHPSLRQRAARWLVRAWEAACRQAERPTRFVPRY